MPTPPATAAEYAALLGKSQLVPPGEAAARLADWPPGPDAPADPFAQHLATAGVLTVWQAALLKRGRADGFVLGGYTIRDQIGKGQMGGVYRAVHALGQIVALKILTATRAQDPRLLGRFQREARLLVRLDHPNVVRAFQVGEAGGRHFIVMECLDGETLDKVLARRGRLPVPEAVRLARQALDGLQHLHDRGMVHRDIKPANLMVAPGGGPSTRAGTVKILDVGLGREMFGEAADGPGADADLELTVEGSVLGTPDYMAPEQARDPRSADIRADIYGLGCTLYHLLTGRPPFAGTGVMGQMIRHATEAAPPLAGLVPGTPPVLQAVLDRLMAKDPDRRFPTPAAAAAALAPFEAADAPRPVPAAVVPAYEKWLETETALPLPAELGGPPDPPPALVKPPARPAVVVKPPTKPAPAAPPVRQPWPGAGSKPAPVPPPRPAPTPTPTPAPIPTPGPRYVVGAVAPEPLPDEVEVELVDLPDRPPAARGVLDPDRRDVLMMAAGGAAVVAATAAGFALARLLRQVS